MKRGLLFSLACLLAGYTHAELLSPQKSLDVLNKIVNAAKSLDYSGSYVYQRGNQVDSYQLTHIDDEKGEAERRESLDGPEKVMVREGERISLYMPDAKYVNLDRHSVTKLFPGLLPENSAELLKVYRVHYLGEERVAAIDSKVLLLEPKDALRYPYKLWYDPHSGLLLRAAMLQGGAGPAIEQFSFTQLQIGANVSRKQLKTAMRESEAKHNMDQPSATAPEKLLSAAPVDIRSIPPGFRLVKALRRNSPKGALTHLMFSDGLSSVSLFLEPLRSNQKPMQGLSVREAAYLYARPLGQYQLTVLGEAPEATVLQFGNNVVVSRAQR